MNFLFHVFGRMLIPLLWAGAIALSSNTLTACNLVPSGAPMASSSSAPQQSTRSPSVSLSLTSADSDRTIQAHPGDTFSIQLSENPTTGYRWAIQNTDEQILELQTSEYSPSGTGMGGSGQRIFTFQVKAAGTVNLQLKEWREWEGDRSITHEFSVIIEAR